MAFKKETNVRPAFTKISIGLASPEEILKSSCGAVQKPVTINYRTYKPERDGLFCERIFGPVKDYECFCGKYKRIRYKGIVCDRCGVEVTEKKVRRERTGHIQLVVPVAHIWYFKSNPNKIGFLLGIPSKQLDAIIYYERYVVINAGVMAENEIVQRRFLNEDEYNSVMETVPADNHLLDDNDPNKFICKMGAEAILMLLQRINLDDLSYELRNSANTETSQQRKNESLKRLQVVEAFRMSREINKPEWMIVTVLAVTPPELRPLVPLDGGRFATSDLNDLYRRVIIRNNRLKRLIDIKAPDVILRNEKRMLQEAVDSLFDNSRKSSAVKIENNRPLKSLSDSLKGKQGRFRQNLLGKRVDYSARSVIVVGPNLKMNECGLPKDMAAELYMPFIIRKLLERGIVKTVKSAKRIVDRREPVVWDILENVLKGHPVMLNRAPTLHRLGIQAFQPKLIEGKAIQLHPLACTGFNADFDGDQMAVHLPLGNEAIMEAQILMLCSHNILNPSNGTPITVPSQDMILGLYYITKPRPGVKGEGLKFYSPQEVIIALNEKAVDMHAQIKVIIEDCDEEGTPRRGLIETTVGRVIMNQCRPANYPYINTTITKKNLQPIIGNVYRCCGIDVTTKFLDDIKDLGYRMAFEGGLSFNLADVIIPAVKKQLVDDGFKKVNDLYDAYGMGQITMNERFNQSIDIWTHVNEHLSDALMRELKADKDGFNSIYMMIDSGARGSKKQICQLGAMRGLMAKPQKSGTSGSQIIETPILANFKEGLSVLEYFISTHGARKGLADTALKTADAGYLTRRLVDVANDITITEEDCCTLRGITMTPIKLSKDSVISLGERVLGRVSVHDVFDPTTSELIVASGQMVTEKMAAAISKSGIEHMEVRSVLTCEARRGVCAKCYGRNLANGRLVEKGEAVGVIAAQSIGEPGTQLTLRTFHTGGTAGGFSNDKSIYSKFAGRVEIEGLRSVDYESQDGPCRVVLSRLTELHIINPETSIVLESIILPHAALLYVKEGELVAKGAELYQWDPLNSVVVTEYSGIVKGENLIEGETFRSVDEGSGFTEQVITEFRDKTKAPSLLIMDKNDNQIKGYNLPVGAIIAVREGTEVVAGTVIAKIPRSIRMGGDITGGLPRVTELFEARNPSNPAVVSEIDGEISYGKIKRGNREVVVTSKTGEEKKYLISLAKQILVQENDYVRAGTPLSDGAITPTDILNIEGPIKLQEYIVKEIQGVYREEGVVINDKHFEIIVHQMMRKVEIKDAGDTRFLESQLVDKTEFNAENDLIYGQKVVEDAGDSDRVKKGQIITARQLRDLNSQLKRRDLKLIQARDAVPATSEQILQGITRAALQTSSFISAASFQETTKVLNDAAIRGKVDPLEGIKENVICGHLIPVGTGLKDFRSLIVASKEEMNRNEDNEEKEPIAVAQ